MSDFARLLCGVPHGSVRGPIRFCDIIILATTSTRMTPRRVESILMFGGGGGGPKSESS